MDTDSNHPFDISEDDIYEAMKEIDGYLDITPGDFRALYGLAHRHAIARLTESVKAGDVMTRKVISVEKETPLTEVADRMVQGGCFGHSGRRRSKSDRGYLRERLCISDGW